MPFNSDLVATPEPQVANAVQAAKPVASGHVRGFAGATQALWQKGVGMRMSWSWPTPAQAPLASMTTVNGTATAFKLGDATFELPLVAIVGFSYLEIFGVFATTGRSSNISIRSNYIRTITGSTTLTSNWKVLPTTRASGSAPGLAGWRTLDRAWTFIPIKTGIGGISGADVDPTARLKLEAAVTLPTDIFAFGSSQVTEIRIASLTVALLHKGNFNRAGA